MWVCLIKPFTGRVHDAEQYYIDIGLGFLATALRKSGHAVRILDCMQQGINHKKFKEFMTQNLFDVYGFKVYSYAIQPVKCAIETIKQINPNGIIIVGGPHPSGVGERIFDFLPEADFAFQGEAEHGLPQLVGLMKGRSIERPYSDRELSDVPGLIWREGNKIRCNPPFFTEDIDSLGYPAWDLLNMENYLKDFRHTRYLAGVYVPVITSRGCPYPCTYCSAWRLSGKKLREHSLDYIMEWIAYLKSRYGVDSFAFVDDALTYNKPRFLQICEELLRRDLRIQWDCATNAIRFDNLDAEMLKLMERSGCFYITVAIESGSQRILQDMRKNSNLEIAREKIELIKRSTNIFVLGYFILGYPTEIEEDIRKTLKISKELLLDAAIFYLFTPHPGTAVTEQLHREGKLDSLEWRHSNYDEPSISLKNCSKFKLSIYRKLGYLSFYLRPKIIFRHLEYLNRLDQLCHFIKAAPRYAMRYTVR